MTALTVTSRRLALVRRTSVVATVLAAPVVLAGTASADVPVGWSDPDDVNMLEALLLFAALPIGMALVIMLLTYLPAMIKGERLAPGAPQLESQWIGGPRKETSELAGPDGDDSQAGGASARW